jgi:hypothetical protein
MMNMLLQWEYQNQTMKGIPMSNEWEDVRKDGKPVQYKLSGFMPFTVDTVINGTLVESKVADDGKGFFILRLSEPATVNIRESATGQGQANIGEYVGVRKTGATACLASLPAGTEVRITYRGMKEHRFTQEDGSIVNTYRHDIRVERKRSE